MRNIFVFGLVLLGAPLTWAQTAGRFDPAGLRVRWESVSNHRTEEKFESAFILVNDGGLTLPASGWSIYFNSPHPIDLGSVTAGMLIEHINGDFYRLGPAQGCLPLVQGQSRRVDFSSGDYSINFTDAPTGLFWVWDLDPDHPISITRYEVTIPGQAQPLMRGETDEILAQTPEQIFEQNAALVDLPAGSLPKVFPTPVSCKETGHNFVLGSGVSVDAGPFEEEGRYLGEKLKGLVAGRASGSPNAAIHFQKAPLAEEAYTLEIKPEGVWISASGPAGIFYGIQSFLTTVPPADAAHPAEAIEVPTLLVSDAPRFGTREFLLDVARNFKGKEEILKVLDLIALYKFNTFHFHLNDDEGWRLEIVELPELTQVGSRRGFDGDPSSHLVPSFGSGPSFSNPSGSGYYTRADFIDILRYAKARHIEVIPEIESPGHARAAVKSMDKRYARLLGEGKRDQAEAFLLHDPGDRSVYSSVQMWNDNVMDIARPSTYHFLETVTDEIVSMYKEANAPLSAIHFGGDEAPAGAWARSPAFAALQKSDPLIRTTQDLWNHYYLCVRDMLRKRGLVLDGWEEMGLMSTAGADEKTRRLNPALADGTVRVDVWNNVPGWGSEGLAYRFANAGYKVILAGVSNLYIDLAYAKAFEEPGYYWGGYISLEKTFQFIPLDLTHNLLSDRMGQPLTRASFSKIEPLTEQGRANVLGIEGSLWGENLPSNARLEYMLLPRLLAIAERAWAKDPVWASETDPVKAKQLYGDAWSVFVNILGKRELPRLDTYAGGFVYRISPVGLRVRDSKVEANLETPGLVIRFTSDGTEPTVSSERYLGPVAARGLIKFRAFDSRGRGGRTSQVENN